MLDGEESGAYSAVRAYVPSKIRLFTSAPNPAVRVCAYTAPGERAAATESGGKGTCKPYWTPS
jgi:hypothetical protein